MRFKKFRTAVVIASVLAIPTSQLLTSRISSITVTAVAQENLEGNYISSIFPDQNLASEIASKLGKKVTDYVKFQEIKDIKISFIATNKEIKNIEGLQYLTGIMLLNLSGNEISDLSPLSNLTNLKYLYLQNNKISEVALLSSLTNLSTLDLENNEIQDISPLGGLAETSVSFIGQRLFWSETAVGEANVLSIIDENGNNPTVKISVGTGEITDNQVIWFSAGDNILTWSSGNYSRPFTGTIFQKVAPLELSELPESTEATEVKEIETEIEVEELETAVAGDLIKNLFPDEIFAKEVALYFSKEIDDFISHADMKAINEFSADGKGITNIQGIEYFTELKDLSLSFNNISDINPLQNMTNLRKVTLVDNKITNITPLKDLNVTAFIDYQKISLADVRVGEVVTINIKDVDGNVPNLNPVVSSGVEVSIIDGANLTWLVDGQRNVEWSSTHKNIRFSGTIKQVVQSERGLDNILTFGSINDLFPDKILAREVATSLDVSINDIIEYKELEKIEFLDLYHAGVESIQGVEYLSNLKFLNLNVNQVSDINPVGSLKKLDVLKINNNNITNIEALRGAISLRELSADNNNISDITTFKYMGKLRTVNMVNNAIIDMSVLNGRSFFQGNFQDQYVVLDQVKIDEKVNVDLLSVNGQTPYLKLSNSDGHFENNQLTWSTPGTKIASWDVAIQENQLGKITFSGSLKQIVVSDGEFADGGIVQELFPDEELAKLIASKLGTSVENYVEFSQLSSITGTLIAPSKQIQSLEGIQYLTGIKGIALSFNKIRDLEPVKNLTNLKHIDLSNNLVSDISYLESLTNLETVYFNANLISDISVLANLTKLEVISLGNNRINDITALGNLTNLKALLLGLNNITDVFMLSKLINLVNLELSFNNINNISYLENMVKLEMLRVSGNNITNISALEKMSDLDIVDVSKNKIVNISALSGKKKISQLNISNNQIIVISPIANFTNMYWLSANNNKISDISALNGNKEIIYLYLDDNQIENISVLGNLENLATLSMNNNEVGDLRPLTNLKLNFIYLDKNKVTDRTPLDNIKELLVVSLKDQKQF